MSGEQKSRYPDSKNSNSIRDGLEFQDWVMETLVLLRGVILQNYSSKKYQLERGENRQGWEIKLDNLCTQTGRLSIETEERTAIDREWVKSGIYTDNSWMYIQGNQDSFWVFSTKILRLLHRAVVEDTEGKPRPRYERKEEPTIRAFYLPISDADKFGERFDAGPDLPF